MPGAGVYMSEPSIIKYDINIEYDVSGIVETRDVLGAVYGQTEDFLKRTLGMDLSAMHGKFIDKPVILDLTHGDDDTHGTARISVYDGEKARDTALLITAAIRDIAQVGPNMCSFKVTDIDNRPMMEAKKIEDIKEKIAKEYGI